MSINPFTLKDKSIFVTGSSAGIGKEIAFSCSNMDANMIITGRNSQRLEDTFNDLKTNSNNQFIVADLKSNEDIEKLVDRLPLLDGIVLNAGIVKTVPVAFIKKEQIQEVFDVNFTSSVVLIQKLLRKKKIKKGASICFISSVASNYVNLGNSLYSASKGAVNSFTKSLALELSSKQIRVNAILPGFIQTSILENSGIDQDSIKEHLNNYPMGRFGKPEDIANGVIYLMSDASTWTTGSLLTIDGGYSIK
ncbi:SDR family NAD(P)-dependent oxidoreductase [Brumimicrobium mesophilum]|uniref:SDR family NAD(P)-dependent oxidoreductase n=1 Tax=Brumimicrobium mesophilum TaxID=392717 RepID=UPI000D1405E8|nr:SDR family oxidoreductase [Brumimicrobium mesophilum]